jgi:hypothetical protein
LVEPWVPSSRKGSPISHTNTQLTGPLARLLVARAATLDAARAVRLSAQEPGADVEVCLEMAARLDRVADELRDVEEALN